MIPINKNKPITFSNLPYKRYPNINTKTKTTTLHCLSKYCSHKKIIINSKYYNPHWHIRWIKSSINIYYRLSKYKNSLEKPSLIKRIKSKDNKGMFKLITTKEFFTPYLSISKPIKINSLFKKSHNFNKKNMIPNR